MSVSVSALMMALTICLYREYHTLNLDEIMMLLRRQESDETRRLAGESAEGTRP